MSSTIEQSIIELKARQDIHDVMARYCHGIDRLDAEMVKACFFEDAIDDHGFFNGSAHEFTDLAVQRLGERFLSIKHHMTTHYVELDGDTALSETYILALSRASNDGDLFDITFSARYLDRFECRDGVWKIAHRQLVSDGKRTDPVEVDPAEVDETAQGARGKQDPSFDFFNS